MEVGWTKTSLWGIRLLEVDNRRGDHPFGDDLLIDNGPSPDGGETGPDLDDLRLESELISGDDDLPELDIMEFAQDDELFARVGDRMVEQDPAGLGHRLDDQDPGHDLYLREMAFKKRFVGGD